MTAIAISHFGGAVDVTNHFAMIAYPVNGIRANVTDSNIAKNVLGQNNVALRPHSNA